MRDWKEIARKDAKAQSFFSFVYKLCDFAINLSATFKTLNFAIEKFR